MENKVLQFDNNVERYRSLANIRLEKEDYIGALDMLFSALNKEFSLDVLEDIANVYSDMGLYELSNKYWFLFLDKAPQERKGTAYEELAFNYFYLENVWVSGYYFNKKLETGEMLNRDSIPEEIIKYYKEENDNKANYKIAYPFNETNYTKELKEGRVAIALGDIRGAKNTLKSIPKKSPQGIDAETEVGICELLEGNVEKAIEITRNLIMEHGESCVLLCNLSSMYKAKKEDDKAQYYYKKALTLYNKTEEETHKLGTCALENNDHFKAVELIYEILKENPYEIKLKFLYGVALLNCGKIEEGAKELNETNRIEPTNLTFNYFSKLANQMLNGLDTKGYTPFLYNGEIPYKEGNKRLSLIGKVVEYDSAMREKELKNAYVKESVKWGLDMGEDEVAKACIFMLSSSKDPKNVRYLLNKLIDDEYSLDLKSLIIYMLILGEYKKKIGVVSSGYYLSFKPKKFAFEKEKNGDVFFTAYALCLSRLVFVNFTSFNQLAILINRAYSALKDYDGIEKLSKEISVVCTILSDTRKLKIGSTCRLFNANEEIVKELLKKLEV